jgi:hypothetical protein
MLYGSAVVNAHTLKEAPMADKTIKNLPISSKTAGDVKGGAKLNKRSSKRSR